MASRDLDAFDHLFQAAGEQYGLDPALLKAHAYVESGINPNVRDSDQGAVGIMQFLPSTARGLGANDPRDPKQAIPAAAKYIAEGYDKFGNAQDAVMYYHGGPDQRGWGPKTHDYLDKVAAAYSQFSGKPMRAAESGAPKQVAAMSPEDLVKLYGEAPATLGGSDQPANGPLTIRVKPNNPGDLSPEDLVKMYGGEADKTEVAAREPGDESAAVGRAIIDGVPVIGPYLTTGVNAAVAGIRHLQSGKSFKEEYRNVKDFGLDTAEAHPYATAGGNLLGAVAGTGGLLGLAAKVPGIGASLASGGNMLLGINGTRATEGALAAARAAQAAGGTAETAAALSAAKNTNMLARIAMGGTGGAALGAADAGVRGDDVRNAALTGGLFGAAAPVAGRVLGDVAGPAINKLTDIASNNLNPRVRANNALIANIEGADQTIPGLRAELARNPKLALADLNPIIQADAVKAAQEGGPEAAALRKWSGDRRATEADTVRTAFANTVGKPTDPNLILDGMRARHAAMETSPAQTRAALDKALGPAENPRELIDNLHSTRAAEAAPLYEAALAQKPVFSDRLERFLQDPVLKNGISKGMEIQRLESLAKGEPFNPSDYVVKGWNDAWEPIHGETPNMRTLNVAKKGLDAMLEEYRDPTSGRLALDERGRALDSVRKAYVNELDRLNPDYAAAREAWAAPSRLKDAFAKGTEIFKNRQGMAGIEDSAPSLEKHLAGLSEDARNAHRIGVRQAVEQAMATASDPTAKAAALANIGANRDKLAAVIGRDRTDALLAHLNKVHGDPIGDAWVRGMDVFKNRSGMEGLNDRPEVLERFLKTAPKAEIEAHKEAVKFATDQALNSVRNAARKGEAIPEVEFNRRKLELTFGKGEADRLMTVLKDTKRMAATNNLIDAGSKTAFATQGGKGRAIRGGNPVDDGLAAMTGAVGGKTALAIRYGLKAANMLSANRLAAADIGRNLLMTKAGMSSGPQAQETLNKLEQFMADRTARKVGINSDIARYAPLQLMIRSGAIPANQLSNQ